MTPFETYRTYIALKSHFQSDYDYFRYAGKVRVNYDSYEKRKDKHFFIKISKNNDAFEFLLSAAVKDPHFFIRDLAVDEELIQAYKDRKKRLESITYVFQTEMNQFEGEYFDDIFRVYDGNHPKLLRAVLGNRVSYETSAILLDLLPKIGKHWKSALITDPIWEDTGRRIVKYAPFIRGRYDRPKIINILKNILDTTPRQDI